MDPNEPPLIARDTGQPRRWITLAAVTCEHAVRSRELIGAAAAAVEATRPALILGPGDCFELPLEELAARCSRLVLVDIHSDGAEQALARMTPNLSERVEIACEDLVGVTANFLNAIDAVLDQADDAVAAVGAMVSAAEQCQPDVYRRDDGPFDLVIASCVLGQLINPATQGAQQRFERRFPGQLETLRGSRAWTEAMYALSQWTEAAFIEALFGLVAQHGRLFLSETVQGCFIHYAPQGRWATEGTYRMIRRPHLVDYLDARFRVERQAHWPWVVHPPTQPGAVGRLFHVEGLLLRLS